MQERAHKQATLHDVARLANVSHQTVSRVINHSPNVAEETRQRVLDAIRELNYRPNRAARSLITGHSQTIQVIVFEETYLTPIPAIISAANDLGYRVGLSVLHHDHSAAELQQLFDDLTSLLVDGFLLFDPQECFDAVTLKQLTRGIPFVQIGGGPIADIPAVVVDHGAGMAQIMDLLISQGHRQIAEIRGPGYVYDGRIRHEAYLEKMRAAGLEPGPCAEGDFGADSAYRLTSELLNRNEKFTALVCGNDEMALGALRAFYSRGIRVPEDVSITGFDDHPFARFFEPPMTTVRQDHNEVSRVGMELLVGLIQNPEESVQQRKIKPQLIIRQSTREI